MRPDNHSDAPSSTSGGSFAGFGEGAPLELSGLTTAGAGGLLSRVIDGTADALSQTMAGVGNCARPVRLVGSSVTIDQGSGEVLDSYASDRAPLGMLYRACGNRRADVCPACARTYARDTFELIRAGLLGGKTIPATVADNPLLFATLTAPSFGHVHGPRPHAGQPSEGLCRPRDKTKLCEHGRPVGCMRRHTLDDPANGSPICDDCYDWESAVVWQWWAPELWRRTTIAIRRALAKRLGVAESTLRTVASLQYAKVAEYQARGVVHFHAMIRLDGPDGPGSPASLDAATFADLVEEAVPLVDFVAPYIDVNDCQRVLSWGSQLDVRPVRNGARTDDPDGPLTSEQVAAYLAKYAGLGSPVALPKDPAALAAYTSKDDGVRGERVHLYRMAQTATELHQRGIDWEADESPYALLGKWAHMLGFRGHFSSKSRKYSVTLGRLRRARRRYQQLRADAERDRTELDLADLEARLLAADEETTLVVGEWAFVGVGWTRPGEQELARSAAARAREYDQWRTTTKTA